MRHHHANDSQHSHGHGEISDRALQVATCAIVAMFILMIVIAVAGLYLRHA